MYSHTDSTLKPQDFKTDHQGLQHNNTSVLQDIMRREQQNVIPYQPRRHYKHYTEYNSPPQNLAHATMRYPELATDVTWTDAVVRKFHYFSSDWLGKRSAVDEQAAQLVYTSLSVGPFRHIGVLHEDK